MAKYIRRTQLEKKPVARHFAIQWSTSARVDFDLLERQTRACSLDDRFHTFAFTPSSAISSCSALCAYVIRLQVSSNQTAETLSRNSLMYMSKANVPIALT